jgi:hypothetical protein
MEHNVKVEWSSDNGRTWRVIYVPPTSPIVVYLPEVSNPYADGVGNVYRRAAA